MSILEKLRAGVVTASAAETQALATELASQLPRDCILALHGDLGVGKTTFVQGLARGFGVSETVTSPTYTIFALHRGSHRLLVHLDAYRLEAPDQLDALLLDDFLASPYCVAIEWPEKIAGWIPPSTIHLDLGITDGERHSVRLRELPLSR